VGNLGTLKRLVGRRSVTLRRRLKDLKVNNDDALKKIKVMILIPSVFVLLKHYMLILLTRNGVNPAKHPYAYAQPF
jgi:hypothetical protein